MRFLTLAAAALLLPAAAMAEISTDVVTYSCDNQRSLDVAYINAGEDSFAVMSEGGALVVLPIAVSASGARYLEESRQLEWWTKGDEGFLTQLGEPEIPLYQNCVAASKPAEG